MVMELVASDLTAVLPTDLSALLLPTLISPNLIILSEFRVVITTQVLIFFPLIFNLLFVHKHFNVWSVMDLVAVN